MIESLQPLLGFVSASLVALIALLGIIQKIVVPRHRLHWIGIQHQTVIGGYAEAGLCQGNAGPRRVEWAKDVEMTPNILSHESNEYDCRLKRTPVLLIPQERLV